MGPRDDERGRELARLTRGRRGCGRHWRYSKLFFLRTFLSENFELLSRQPTQPFPPPTEKNFCCWCCNTLYAWLWKDWSSKERPTTKSGMEISTGAETWNRVHSRTIFRRIHGKKGSHNNPDCCRMIRNIWSSSVGHDNPNSIAINQPCHPELSDLLRRDTVNWPPEWILIAQNMKCIP